MNNQGQVFSALNFIEKLSKNELEPSFKLTGMVKKDDADEKSLLFTNGSCTQWVKIASDMIESIELIDTVSCRDHTHPLVTITFTQPSSEEALAYAKLAQIASSIVATKVQNHHLSKNPTDLIVALYDKSIKAESVDPGSRERCKQCLDECRYADGGDVFTCLARCMDTACR
jgi:hypothetical protein